MILIKYCLVGPGELSDESREKSNRNIVVNVGLGGTILFAVLFSTLKLVKSVICSVFVLLRDI